MNVMVYAPFCKSLGQNERVWPFKTTDVEIPPLVPPKASTNRFVVNLAN